MLRSHEPQACGGGYGLGPLPLITPPSSFSYHGVVVTIGASSAYDIQVYSIAVRCQVGSYLSLTSSVFCHF
jgi:hypothetical protein